MSEIRPKYVMKYLVIDKESIAQFWINTAERRKLRSGKVAMIRSSFSKADLLLKHFDSPIVVNHKDKMYRVIDGNHRLEAIIQELNNNPLFSIKVWLVIYAGLDRGSERIIYTKWNKGTPESSTDYLKYHFATIPLGKKMLAKLPVSIYGSETKMPIKNLVGSHIVAKGSRFSGGYSAGGERTVSDFTNLTEADIQLMSAFCKDMEQVFGSYTRENIFYKTTPITAFYKIWFDNLSIPRDKFIRALKKFFAERWIEWSPRMKSGGREATKFFYVDAIRKLKEHRRSLQWTGSD